jgi:hypothetical protein
MKGFPLKMPAENEAPSALPEPPEELASTRRGLYLAAAAGVVALAVLGYFLLRSPAPKPEPPPQQVSRAARFTAIEGSVKVKHVGTFEWIDATERTLLRQNDLVRTGAGSSAKVTFFDGTTVNVRPDSLITIEESFEDPSTRRRRVALDITSGEVNFETGQRNVRASSTEFSTPTIRVRQGEMAAGGIRVAETGHSDVRQFRGSGEVETKAGDVVQLASREALKVDATGKASEKLALPGMPELVAPPNRAEIGYVNPSREATLLTWNPVPGATAYRVMLDYTDAFNRPLVDQRGIQRNAVELQGLEPGRYYWRVSALGDDLMEGPPSELSGFLLVKADAPPPPLEIEMLDVRMNILQIKGRTAPGAIVTVNGQPVDVGPDGRFSEFLTLDQVGKQTIVVRATGQDGATTEETRPVVVTG